jgi:Arabinose-binding domain of AraC transcription regulator, N-term
LGNSALGLELGSEFSPSAMGPIVRLMQSARTLGDALEKYSLYYGTVQSDTRRGLSVSDGTARLVYSISDPAIRIRAQDADFTIAVEFSMLASLPWPESAGHLR